MTAEDGSTDEETVRNRTVDAHLELSTRYPNIEIAERVLVDGCVRAQVGETDRDAFLTALRESLANAMRHGNREDADRNVIVDLRIGFHQASIRVEDEGEGFDPDAVPDPTAPEHLLRPSGRGIFYMRQFMNRVEFSRAPGGGTVVTMTRRLDREARS